MRESFVSGTVHFSRTFSPAESRPKRLAMDSQPRLINRLLPPERLVKNPLP